jgi:iron complex transport system ATP-binding protein
MNLLTRTRHRLPSFGGDVPMRAHGVGVRHGDATILQDVDLEVLRGEILALVGPNGAGKSTLLAALSGDVDASGTVLLNDEPLASWTPVEQAMRRAVLLQEIALSFPYTAQEVVAMGRAPWAATPFEDGDEAAIAAAMAATDVAGLARRKFSTLSGGEKARVALARVLAQRTPILLLDEPTAALDLHHQELVMGVARGRADAGDAIVVVLHDLNLAAAHVDRVAVLSEGRLVACGRPPDVLTAELLSHVYRHPVDVFPHPRTGNPLITTFARHDQSDVGVAPNNTNVTLTPEHCRRAHLQCGYG